MTGVRLSVTALIVLGLFVSANGSASRSPAAAIRALIDAADPALAGVALSERASLHELYRPGQYAPLWLDPADRPSFSARQAFLLLNHAADEGLESEDYEADRVGRLMHDLDTELPQAVDIARFDVSLSAGVLRYLRHLHEGRVDPRSLGFHMNAPRDVDPFSAPLRAAIADERLLAFVGQLRPPLAQYRMVREMLSRYRALANDPSFVAIPGTDAVIHPGDAYRASDLLRRELAALGDLPDSAVPPAAGRYDGVLVDAVRRFQIRHGLDADGVVGKKTIDALRVPLPWRVRQIELALERLRWLPRLGNQRLIVLNIPMFRLWVWDVIPADGAPLFGMDVIVGRGLTRQTPVIVEQMREVIFRPYWNVPPSIARHEVLPAIMRDPTYLIRQDMEIVSVSGSETRAVAATRENLAALSKGALRVRQRPGPKNALGLIKFVFPNDEDIYMHGTPQQSLFANSRRDFSHGCVRAADPVALAEWVMRDVPEWTRDRILAATAGTSTIGVRLPAPITVILFYTTAAVMPEDGTIRFADDIYHHDEKLDRALVARSGTN